jgi:hypothetical protein
MLIFLLPQVVYFPEIAHQKSADGRLAVAFSRFSLTNQRPEDEPRGLNQPLPEIPTGPEERAREAGERHLAKSTTPRNIEARIAHTICALSSVLSHVPAQNFAFGFTLSLNLKRGTACLAPNTANAIHARETLNPGK